MHAELTLMAGDGTGRKYILRVAQTFVVGRAQEAAIRITDSAVSRKHAELHLDAQGALWLTDLESYNGTFLQGRLLEPLTLARVLSGDAITIGANVIGARLVGLDDETKGSFEEKRRHDAPVLPPDEFEIIGGIGEGSHGRVYAAHQRLLNRTVAVKIMAADVPDGDEEWQRFLREGQTCSRLESPHVVKVYDIRLVRGRIFLVMELVNGPSLKDRLSSGPLPLSQVLKIGRDVAEGLVAAHAAGVIHRDVKPSNILLSPSGAKLGDFGCAKDLNSTADLTDSNLGLGSLPYVAPEQASDAKRVDERTDIYALGATLYHAISGRPPFLATTPQVLLDIVERPPPSLVVLRPETHRDVARLIHAMLDKDPAARPPSAASVERQLDELRQLVQPAVESPILRSSGAGETARLPRGFYQSQASEDSDPDEGDSSTA